MYEWIRNPHMHPRSGTLFAAGRFETRHQADPRICRHWLRCIDVHLENTGQERAPAETNVRRELQAFPQFLQHEAERGEVRRLTFPSTSSKAS
jgi:hypothetical protein